jgi:DNA-binding response OmpR family regulator
MARILVIDDDPHMRGMLKKYFERTGHEVLVAEDGSAGISLHKSDPADIIITDMVMPEKEGLETILELQKDFPSVKIIAISGGGRIGPKDYLAMAHRFGAARTFSKPFALSDIGAAVEDLLR